jgi:hypothetical protein
MEGFDLATDAHTGISISDGTIFKLKEGKINTFP